MFWQVFERTIVTYLTIKSLISRCMIHCFIIQSRKTLWKDVFVWFLCGYLKYIWRYEYKYFLKWLVSTRNWPKLLPHVYKAIDVGFYMLFCIQIVHTRTGQCLLYRSIQLSNCAATDWLWGFWNLKDMKEVYWCFLYNHV